MVDCSHQRFSYFKNPHVIFYDMQSKPSSVQIISKSNARNPVSFTVDQRKKKEHSSNFRINDRRKMKLVPINMDWCLLSLNAFKFSLGGCPYRGCLCLTFIFSMKTPNFENEMVMFTTQIAWIQIFTIFLKLI